MYVLKWWIMATMGLWQYIAITLLVSLKSGQCHKPFSYKHIFPYSSDHVQTYKRMRLTTQVYGMVYYIHVWYIYMVYNVYMVYIIYIYINIYII